MDNISFIIDGLRGELSKSIEVGRKLSKRVEELSEFIYKLPCNCHDEWGNPFPTACDRCTILGIDRRS